MCQEAFLWLEDVASRGVRRDQVLSHFPLERANSYYGLVSSASNLLGEVSTAKDWGLQTENEVYMDASA